MSDDREHDRIWWIIEAQGRSLETLTNKVAGMDVLNERLSTLIASVKASNSAKRWIIVQFIATCGVLLTALDMIVTKG